VLLRPLQIGPYRFENNLALAPMAGVTDRPFRMLCRRLGAGLAEAEMLTADSLLWDSPKSRARMDHGDEPAPRSVQIAGADPAQLAEAAALNVERGAQIIDINMGCPAKKVCNRAAGSALLRDEGLVAEILQAVVAAVSAPVTLKLRTGWDPAHRNGPRVARLAEAAGIAALAVHGRTRACAYKGEAEYETIRRIVEDTTLPVIANGDIDSPQKAREVLEHTGADAIMIGRAAQGNPWLFREVAHYLETGRLLPPPPAAEIAAVMIEHLRGLHALYGVSRGVRVARKHLGWYLHDRADDARRLRARLMQVDGAEEQIALLQAHFGVRSEGLAA
jgi:tRNA-dihydrouridine synthase B